MISFNDKTIFHKLKSIGIPVGKKYDSMIIPKTIKTDPTLFKNFIRGVFDTDGCVVISKQHRKNPYYPRIEITSKSRPFLEDILIFLKSINFYGSISNKSGCWRLELSGFQNTELWISNIGSNNPKQRQKLTKFDKTF